MPESGIEPLTYWLRISCATPELHRRSNELIMVLSTLFGLGDFNKSGSNLNVICGMNGSEEAMSTDSNTESMTWGNILVGGLIGYAVAAGTGFSHQKLPSVTCSQSVLHFLLSNLAG